MKVMITKLSKALLTLVSVWGLQGLAMAQTYYVDPKNGLDANNGTSLTSAFQTLAKARDVVRANKGTMSQDITVYLRGGTHSLASTLTFDERDSGTNGFSVIWRAYGAEKPVISGGHRVTGWTQVAGTNIWKATVTAVADLRQLYVNGESAQRARQEVPITGTGWYDDPAYTANPEPDRS